jgi:hypothetical protein
LPAVGKRRNPPRELVVDGSRSSRNDLQAMNRRSLAAALVLTVLLAPQLDARSKRRPTKPPSPPPSLAEPGNEVLSVRPSADGTRLLVKGWLDVGSFLKFRRVLAANPGVRTVILASAGGLVQEGVLIGSTIREAKLDTRVETICASACTLLVVAGRERSAAPEAWIGFHRARAAPRSAASSLDELPTDPDILQRGTLRRAGIDPVFIEAALNVPEDDIWFPDAKTLVSAGVLTIVPDAASPSSYATTEIETAIADEMRKTSLWKLVEAKDSAGFAKALGLAWRLSTAGADQATALAEAQSALGRASVVRLASAPDTLALGMLRSMASTDPMDCANSGLGARLAFATLQQEQAPLWEGVLQSSSAVDPPSADDAHRALRRPILAVRRAYPGVNRASEIETRCRAGIALLREIAHLGERKRVAAFRAYAVLQDVKELPGFSMPL